MNLEENPVITLMLWIWLAATSLLFGMVMRRFRHPVHLDPASVQAIAQAVLDEQEQAAMKRREQARAAETAHVIAVGQGTRAGAHGRLISHDLEAMDMSGLRGR